MINCTFPASADAAIAYFGRAGSELESVGHWQGKDAERLGLAGEVDLADWRALVRGKAPDGTKLAQILRDDRRCLMDVTISVAKPVALLAAFGDPSIRDAIADANRSMMDLAESLMATRVKGLFGQERVTTGSMISAPFYHQITRAREPGDHIHNTVIALTHRKGRWYAPDFDPMVRSSEFLKAHFHNEVARSLRAKGHQTKATKDSFTISGFPEPACVKLSTGKANIDKAVDRREASLEEQIKATKDTVELRKLEDRVVRLKSPKGRAALAVVVRDKKRKDLNPAKLDSDWRGKLTSSELKAIAKLHHDAAKRRGTLDVDKSAEHLQATLVRLLEAESAVSEEKLLTQTLRAGVGEVTLTGLKTALEQGEYVRAEVEINGTDIPFVTTRKALAMEREILAFAEGGKRPMTSPVRFKPNPYDDPLHDAGKLGKEGQAACQHVWRSRSNVTLLRTSKKLRAAVEGAAISMLKESGHVAVVDAAKPLEAMKGDKPSVVWLSNADKLRFSDLHKLTQWAEGHNARLVLSGDLRDYRKAERGKAMSLLEDVGELKTSQAKPLPKIVQKAVKVGKQVQAKLLKQVERTRHVEFTRRQEVTSDGQLQRTPSREISI